jgi:hypothetical protein
VPAWLIPAITSAISVVGGAIQNRSSAAEARRNRQFQQRMSSTAAQRSSADYSAAGFNPALAYDRPASSPGGSVAPVEDVVGKGVSSGVAARLQMSQLKLVEEQARNAEAQARISNAEATVADGKAAPWQNTGPGSLRDFYGKTEMARMIQELALQPWQLNQARAQAQLTGAGIPGAQAEAQLWKNLDRLGPIAKGALPLLRLIRPR